MKIKTVILLFLFIVNHSYSQYIYSDTTWERWYGEQGNFEASSTSKHDIEHYDKGYVFYGYDGGFVTYNAYIKKTDINGYYLWERRLDPAYKKTIHSMNNYHDGGVIICGESSISGIPNPWVAKLNACMEVEWCRIFSWNSFSYANDIAEDQNGDIIVLTDFYGHSPNERISLIKMTADGEILWKKNYATRDDYSYIWNAFGRILIIGNDNNYYIAGDADWPTNNDPNQGSGGRSFFIKVNPNGDEEWILPFGIYDNLYSYASSFLQLNDHSFISVGLNWDSLNPVIMHFNHMGEEISFQTKKIMPEIYSDNYFTDTKTINSNLFFSIWRYKYDPYDTPLNGYMLHDSLLNIIDYKETPEILRPNNLIKTFNNKIVTIAHMKEQDDPSFYDTYLNKQNIDLTYDSVYTAWPGTYDSLCEGGVVSGFLPYTCETIVGINEIPSPEQYKEAQEKIAIQVQPNPSQTQTTLLLQNTTKFKNIELEIFNTAGEKQYGQKIISGTTEVNIDISYWPQGIYFVIIRSQGKILGNAKLNVVR